MWLRTAQLEGAWQDHNPHMFKLELDLLLYFVPPMDERGQGIRLTRSLELPFPPINGLYLSGIAMDDPPTPMGCRINDLTWDLDRQVFMATTQLTNHDFPIATIPDEIGSWIDADGDSGATKTLMSKLTNRKTIFRRPQANP